MKKIKNYMNKYIYSKSPNVKKEIEKRKSYLSISDNSLSIISNNCLAGTIYHDYGLEFKTPIINCYVSWLEYPRFIKRIKEYVSVELEEYKNCNISFPVGKLSLEDEYIEIYFNHSKTFQEAKEMWYRRKDRINYDNILLLIDTFGHQLTKQYIEEIKELSKEYRTICLYSIKNNGIIKEYPFVSNNVYDYKNYDSSLMCKFKGMSGKRYYEDCLSYEMIFNIKNIY